METKEAREFQPIQVCAIDPRDVASSDEPPEIDPETGLPKVLRSYIVHREPDIAVIPNFVNDAEIEHLLKLAGEQWVPSTVGSGSYTTNDETKDLKNKASKNRTSYSCMLRSRQTPTVKSIEQRLAHLAGIDVDFLERLNMVRYAPGQLFNRHHDGRFRPKTVFLYLNDLPEGAGGETLFPELGVQFVPRKGCAVMWSNVVSPGVEDVRTYHQGLPPKEGMKYGVNCFFNDKPLRQWENADSDEERQADAERTEIDPEHLLRSDCSDLKEGQIRAFTICQNPRLRVVPGFLSSQESQALMRVADSPPPTAADAAEAAEAAGDEAADGRNQQREEDLEIFRFIEQRMAALAELPLAHLEPLRVSKCHENMIPDGHALAKGDYSKRFGHRVVYVFLNEEGERGDVVFSKLRLSVRPRTGTAIVWTITQEDGNIDLRAAHQGRAPKGGTRYTAMGIFRDVPVRVVHG